MSANQGLFAKLKSFLLVVGVLAMGVLAWMFTPLSSWLMPPAKTTTAQPNQPQLSQLYAEQTQLPLSQYPAKLQGLEKHWRIQLKRAIDKGLFGETVSFKISDLAHKQWAMETKQALYFEDNSGGAFLKAVEGKLLNPQGQVVGQFKAPYGNYNAKTQVIHLQGGIQFQGLASR
jgi:hypothetical protein